TRTFEKSATVRILPTHGPGRPAHARPCRGGTARRRLYISGFRGHDWWATGLFIAAMTTDWFDGRVARSRGRSSPLGSLLDPVADKLLVLTVLIVLVGRGVFPGWMVAAIVAREFLVSSLRLAALERGVV